MHLKWSGTGKVTVEADALAGSKFKNADVFMVVARDAVSSNVMRGENSGRKLEHVSVASKMMLAGKITAMSGLTKEFSIDAGGDRVIAFVQAPDQGRILGSAILRATP